jgi:membrane protein
MKEEAKILFKKFWENFNKHDLLTLSAALAFYTALSLAPLLLLSIAAMSLLGPRAEANFITQVQMVLGSQAGQVVKLVVDGAQNRPDLSKIGGIIGIVVLAFSASGVFAQLQSSLNLIWSASASNHSGVWSWFRHRLVSMGMVVTLGFLSIVSLALTAVLSFIFSQSGIVWQLINQVSTLALFTLMFAAIYKVLPDTHISWRQGFKGGLVTALLFTAGKYLIGLYLGKSAVGSAYGATGSLIVFLVWVYYSAFTLFIGAELTAVLTFKEEGTIHRLNPPAARQHHYVQGSDHKDLAGGF